MVSLLRVSVISCACAVLAGCGPSLTSQPSALQPAPLQPAPVGRVTTNTLPPVGTQPQQPTSTINGVPTDQLASNNQDLQAIPTAPAPTSTAPNANVSVSPTKDFGLNDVVGAWRVATTADACALNLSLTTWTGGRRASTRKCSSTDLTGIGAWRVAGKQLTLLDATGNTVARLIASGDNRFDGTLETGGKAISVSR